MIKIFTNLFLLSCLMLVAPTLAFSQQAKPKTVAMSFGGECMGENYNFSTKLKELIKNYRLKEESPCEGEYCDNAFAYDLNGNKRKEYFVRLHCGATGNCSYGIFSDRPAKLHGTFTAWFFFIHKRNGSWSKISTYTREGGDQGLIESWVYRRKKYTQVAERTERLFSPSQKPFYAIMGMPECP